MNKKELEEKVKQGAHLRHAHLQGADLQGAHLQGADLRHADLQNAHLQNAHLQGADLRHADLQNAHLQNAHLQDAYLQDAYLQGAHLQDAYLQGAHLRDADLQGADLRDADLRDADLRGADLRDAHLRGAHLYGAHLPPISILADGELVVWKKLKDGVIAKLLITTKTKRVNSTGRKCRAEYVKVLALFKGKNKFRGVGIGQYDGKTEYRMGKIVRPDKYDPDFRVECSHGIHFFITRQEAEDYI